MGGAASLPVAFLAPVWLSAALIPFSSPSSSVVQGSLARWLVKLVRKQGTLHRNKNAGPGSSIIILSYARRRQSDFIVACTTRDDGLREIVTLTTGELCRVEELHLHPVLDNVQTTSLHVSRAYIRRCMRRGEDPAGLRIDITCFQYLYRQTDRQTVEQPTGRPTVAHVSPCSRQRDSQAARQRLWIPSASGHPC